ncbi:hypothetical protein LguiB_021499 [Lonicera macranthoides]
MDRTPLHVDPYIIGIDSQVKNINMWLQDGSNNDRVRGIYGMGGIGKTTIAKIIYNQNFDCFEGSSFLASIGEVLKQPNGSLRLQRQLLSDISKRKHGEIHNDHGTKVVEGLTLDMHMLKEAGNHGKKCGCEEFRDKSGLLMHTSSLKRSFLNFNYGLSASTTITSRNDAYLRTDALKSLRKLRLLKLNYVQLSGSFDNFPKGIAWLSWHGFPLKSIPVEFHLKKLVALDLSHSRLKQLWMETPFLGSLKILDLSYSIWLAKTPNFLRLPKLERLILKGCVSLVEVCESINSLKMLDLLDLQDCKTLRKLPRNIRKLGSLKTLIISGCNIGELPSEIRNMKSLKVFKADGVFINPLRTSSGEVKCWERIVRSKGMLEHQVFSIYLQGSAIPRFTGEKCEGSSSICFTVPWLPTHRIQCLNAWCKFERMDLEDPILSIKIENKTKDLTWINHAGHFSLLYDYIGWLSRWRFGNELEARDEIIITFDCNNIGYVVNECGYKILYYEEEEKRMFFTYGTSKFEEDPNEDY